MTGKQLKNSILQWAIQGKLVPQDPNDEPASVLLEKIRAEKARLIKDKKDSIIYRGEDNSYYEKFADGKVICIDDEIPFDIPMGWEWSRLNNICELIEDCPHSTAPDEGEGYPLIRTPNVGYGKLELKDVHRVCKAVYLKRNVRATPVTHDLIFAREAPAGNIAVIEDGEQVCLGQRTVLVRPFKEHLNPYYLAYYILSPISQQILVNSSTGTTVAHVNLSDFRPYLIAIPPYKEQLKIVEMINSVIPVVNQYGNMRYRIDILNDTINIRLKKSILQEAIQGKLIPQDPNDEPASILLQRIKEEKVTITSTSRRKVKRQSALTKKYLLRFPEHGNGFGWMIFANTYNEGNHRNIHLLRNILLLLKSVISGAVFLLTRHSLSCQKPFRVMGKNGNCRTGIYFGTQQDLEHLDAWLYIIPYSILTNWQ